MLTYPTADPIPREARQFSECLSQGYQMSNPNSVPNRSFNCFYVATVAAVGLLITCFQWHTDSFGFLLKKMEAGLILGST